MGCVHGKCARAHGSSSPKRSVEGKVKVKGKGAANELQNHPNEIHTCYRIHTSFKNNPNDHFFGVFDDHGQYGEDCEEFIKKRLSEILLKEPLLFAFIYFYFKILMSNSIETTILMIL